MQLHYLDFDFSDEDSGRGSFDAMASVLPDRVAPLLAEVEAVLAWARKAFGAASEEGEWDCELQELAEPDERTTVTLTLSGSPAFCEAFRLAFGVTD